MNIAATDRTCLRLGAISIERVVEMEHPFLTPAQVFRGFKPEEVETLRPEFEPWALCPGSGRIILTVQSYLVRTSRHVALIDTCVGCGKTNPFLASWHKRSDGSWLARLTAAGVPPEAVDFVFCTHLHSDHCGWNTRLLNGRWVPTFPNATYVLSRRDVEHAQANPSASYAESVLPVIEAGQAVLVETDYALDDELWLEPTPGHSPGHVAVRLKSGDLEAVMCGDLIHSPLQCAHPEWHFVIDHDPQLARATRRAFLEDACESGRTVLTAHFPSPSMGHVTAKGAAFGFRHL